MLMPSSRVFYGWWVAVAFSVMVFVSAGVRHAVGPFLKPMVADLGVDRQVLAHYQRQFDRNNPVPPAGAWRAIQPAPEGPWSLDLAFTPE